MFKTASFLVFFLFTQAVFGAEPVVTIESKESYNGFGTVTGRVSSDGSGIFLVTVENAGRMFHTVTDAEGRFGIVFRHRSVKFDISAKPFSEMASSFQ